MTTFASALQDGGYATDPNYAQKIVAVADDVRALINNTSSSDKPLKFAALSPTNGGTGGLRRF